jgi:hypothetical protein
VRSKPSVVYLAIQTYVYTGCGLMNIEKDNSLSTVGDEIVVMNVPSVHETSRTSVHRGEAVGPRRLSNCNWQLAET